MLIIMYKPILYLYCEALYIQMCLTSKFMSHITHGISVCMDRRQHQSVLEYASSMS